MDDIRFREILKDCGLSANGISILNNLLLESHIELLNNIINFSRDDIDNLAKIKPCMENSANEISDAFYFRLAGIEGLGRKLNADTKLLEQLKLTNADYLKSLFELNYDENYYKNRIAVGLAHNIFGISPSIYIAIYSYYNNLVSSFILKCCQKNGLSLVDTLKTVNSIQKKLTIDTTFAIESYYKKSIDDFYKIEQASFSQLVTIAEYRDEDTGRHILRVSNFAKIIASELGMDKIYQEQLLHAAPMHDIGKVGIPDKILLKPGRFTKEEFEIMKSHCEIGHNILKNSESQTLKQGAIIALSHHENFNGTGYPKGLKGEEIPLEGRITKIADVFDALVNKRIYKPAFTIDETIKIIRDEMKPKEAFDPDCFNAFFKGLDEIIEVKKNIDGNGHPDA